MKKNTNLIEKWFLVQEMNVYKNKMLHQILNDRHPSTFAKTKSKGLL